MCLSFITDKIPDQNAKGVGYKFLIEYRKRIYTPYCYLEGVSLTTSDSFSSRKDSIELNKTYNAVNRTVEYDLDKIYTSGFHIYENKLDAERNARRSYIGDENDIYDVKNLIVEVEYEDVICRGRQDVSETGDTIVANKMKITKILN